ncbi:hypothetical protein IAU60_005043 [Kwoniella sp. DSM 27419]
MNDTQASNDSATPTVTTEVPHEVLTDGASLLTDKVSLSWQTSSVPMSSSQSTERVRIASTTQTSSATTSGIPVSRLTSLRGSASLGSSTSLGMNNMQNVTSVKDVVPGEVNTGILSGHNPITVTTRGSTTSRLATVIGSNPAGATSLHSSFNNSATGRVSPSRLTTSSSATYEPVGVHALDLGEIGTETSPTTLSKEDTISSSTTASTSSDTATLASASSMVHVATKTSSTLAIESTVTANSTPGDALGPLNSGNSADRAQATPETTQQAEEGKLNSLQIVGIVAGVIVAVVMCYLAWLQWRKKQAHKAPTNDLDDDDEETFVPAKHNGRFTRSSFGAAEPITPYIPHRALEGDYPQTVYEDELYERDARTSNTLGRGRSVEYRLQDDLLPDPRHPPPDEDPFDLPHSVRASEVEVETEYDFASHNGNMGETGSKNPFVPPVPPMPSRHSANKRVFTGRNATQRREASRSDEPRTFEPSTSKLLPWLNKGDAEVSSFTKPSDGLPRAPPEALMAQTPKMQPSIDLGGELGAAPIPRFR